MAAFYHGRQSVEMASESKQRTIWILVWCVPSDGSANERDPSVQVTLFTNRRKLKAALDKTDSDGTRIFTVEERDALMSGKSVDWDERGHIQIYAETANPDQLCKGSII